MLMEKILVIDDSKITQVLIEEIFLGIYDVLFRDNGLEGIAAVRELSPDLILLDIHMPLMDGFEVCRVLKGDETTKAIPLLFLTTLASDAEKVRGFASGAEDYIIKPFHREELLARIRVHLALSNARKQGLELERLNVFKEMAVAISHEINNPLTSIYAFLHVLQRDLAESPPIIQNSLQGIRAEIKRIQEITGKLAHASKVAQTSYNRDITMIDLHNV
jgi:DNA-binding response OmpR family regulator